jgi:hypothetical protein
MIYNFERAKHLSIEKDERVARKKTTESCRMMGLGKLDESHTQDLVEKYEKIITHIFTHYNVQLEKPLSNYTKELSAPLPLETKSAYVKNFEKLKSKYQSRQPNYLTSKGIVAILSGSIRLSEKGSTLLPAHIVKATELVVDDERFVEELLEKIRTRG